MISVFLFSFEIPVYLFLQANSIEHTVLFFLSGCVLAWFRFIAFTAYFTILNFLSWNLDSAPSILREDGAAGKGTLFELKNDKAGHFCATETDLLSTHTYL